MRARLEGSIVLLAALFAREIWAMMLPLDGGNDEIFHLYTARLVASLGRLPVLSSDSGATAFFHPVYGFNELPYLTDPPGAYLAAAALLRLLPPGVPPYLWLRQLAVLGGAPSLNVFSPEQLQALALIFLKLNSQAFNIAMTFFGLHVLSVGYLIFRSTFLPRILGVLVAITGVCYLTNGFANFLSLPFKGYLFPFVAASGLVGEGSLAIWLLMKGVNVQRWKEQASLGV